MKSPYTKHAGAPFSLLLILRRTFPGTICAIDSTWELLKKHGLHAPQFDIFGTVSLLRRQRVAMVQTKDQYVFVYKAILDLVQKLLSAMENESGEQQAQSRSLD